ncbi:hypothetical protein QGX11_gp107 [Pseudomonas phage PPSC2]|uniref:Uncharacterized protein n=1 Tax=Pseudomonas phage PPSC2 TaxID=2041350 RepID=A0A2R2YAZ0_9CAUD|nr:hypothetical protein QGX11_gp107 [Pseudomonas phage PPSC2]ATN92870.1 hypothetical protein PPSC2_107 [Pseudomonas phage PPSC2]
MIKKIRSAMYYANKGMGHMMNGHNKRCYIQNAQGHNIMRLDWVGGPQGYLVWGSESRDITKTVKSALASVVVRELMRQRQKDKAKSFALAYSGKFVTEGESSLTRLAKSTAIAASCAMLTACQSSGTYTVMSSFFCAMFT